MNTISTSMNSTSMNTDSFKFLHSYRHLSLFHFRFELHFLSLNLHLHSYFTCLVPVFDSFIFTIVVRTLKFTSFVLFGTHGLSDRSIRVYNFHYTYLN